MMKTSITAAERLQLIGLLTLARFYDKQTHAIRSATEDLLGITSSDDAGLNDPSDHVSDAVWDHHDADELLKRLTIPVVEGELQP
jgi:hypothetical protein